MRLWAPPRYQTGGACGRRPWQPPAAWQAMLIVTLPCSHRLHAVEGAPAGHCLGAAAAARGHLGDATLGHRASPAARQQHNTPRLAHATRSVYGTAAMGRLSSCACAGVCVHLRLVLLVS